MIKNYITVWKIYLASWFQQWDMQRTEVERFGRQFQKIPLEANLVWNIVNYSILIMTLLSIANFSKEFQHFALTWVLIPSIVSSLTFFRYKYGPTFLNDVSIQSLCSWLHNFYLMQALSFVGFTHTAIIYILGLVIEPLLPESLQWSFQFSTSVKEDSLRHTTFCFLGFAVILALMTPLWQRGYNLSMKISGRKAEISKIETLLELIYQSSQASIYMYFLTPVTVMLENAGIRFHFIHILLATSELTLANISLNYKFSIIHQLYHEIKPLYFMVHIEHHLCKSIHPTNLGAGVWEGWAGGSSIFLSVVFLNAIPYSIFQIGYCGVNIVVHTMWPYEQLLQYHTLHHTTHADIYSGNIPSHYDWKNSKSLKQIGEKIKDVSLFAKYEPLSDIAGIGLNLITGFLMHHIFNIGVTTLNWEMVDWYSHTST